MLLKLLNSIISFFFSSPLSRSLSFSLSLMLLYILPLVGSAAGNYFLHDRYRVAGRSCRRSYPFLLFSRLLQELDLRESPAESRKIAAECKCRELPPPSVRQIKFATRGLNSVCFISLQPGHSNERKCLILSPSLSFLSPRTRDVLENRSNVPCIFIRKIFSNIMRDRINIITKSVSR